MKSAPGTCAAAIIAVFFALAPAYGLSGPVILDVPQSFISQPPFIPINDFSLRTCRLTAAVTYGYERYHLQVPSSLPLHRAGMHCAASGALIDALGWNLAIGLSFPAMAVEYASIRPGSCIVPLSASLAWRFAGASGSSNIALISGVTYAYSAVRGYYRRDVWGPPDLFHFIRVVALADILGSVYGLFAGISPMLRMTGRVSLRPFGAYRITFDTSGFYYHFRLKILNDEPERSASLGFKYRQARDAGRPDHEIIAGLELNMYGAGVHVVVQHSPGPGRTMVQAGVSYSYCFTFTGNESARTGI